jgi:hypothetical protein
MQIQRHEKIDARSKLFEPILVVQDIFDFGKWWDEIGLDNVNYSPIKRD